jgi:hypothetical protein
MFFRCARLRRNWELRNALAIRNRQLATFSRITGMVALGGEIDVLLERLLLTTMQSFNLARGTVHMLDPHDNRLLLVRIGASRRTVVRIDGIAPARRGGGHLDQEAASQPIDQVRICRKGSKTSLRIIA